MRLTRYLAPTLLVALMVPAGLAADEDRAAAAKDAMSKENMQPAAVRASILRGTEVTNRDGDALGEIEDIVISAGSGKVRYMALSSGGFIDIGDDLFAVPFKAFKVMGVKHNQVFLPVSKSQLSRAEGFPEDKWPDQATFALHRDDRPRDRGYEQAGEVRTQREQEQKADKQKSDKQKKKESEQADQWIKLTAVLGETAHNRAGEDLGTVDDLVIATDSGYAHVAVIKIGTVAGMGGNLVAVPMTRSYRHKDTLRFKLTKEELRQARLVTYDALDKQKHDQWVKQVYARFDEQVPEHASEEDEGMLGLWD
jgi:sporulation protein YlmC with PRC-barrel domain